jgi:hypothetical protein
MSTLSILLSFKKTKGAFYVYEQYSICTWAVKEKTPTNRGMELRD